MNASRLARFSALLASCSTLLAASASHAISLDGAPQLLLSTPGGQCIRSPDVTFEGDSYYVVFARGPCTGSGNHEVMIGRWNPATPSSFAPITVWNQMLPEVRFVPTVRVASAAGLITVTSVDRADAVHEIRMDFFAPNLSRPMMSLTPWPSTGTVLQQSLDCATGAMPSCVLSTLEVPIGFTSPRVVAYFAPGTATPVVLTGRMDLPSAVASVAGAPGQSAVAFVTNSITMSAPHAMVATAPVAATATLGASGEPALPGVAAMIVQGAGAAFWTVPGFLEFATRPTWIGAMRLVSGRATVTGAQTYFTIEDGVPVGNNAMLVARNSSSTSNTESSPIAFTSFVPENGLMAVPLVATTVAPRSPTRVASGRNHCPLFGTALAVYAAGASTSSELVLQRLTCSMNSECVDSAGTVGSCVANRCVFPVGTSCNPSADAGVDAGPDAALDGSSNRDSGVDASSSDGSNPTMDASGDSATVPPIDVLADDASSTMDVASAPDTMASGDASALPDGASMPAVTGGACACRVGVARARDARPFALGALVVLAALARRRRAR
ncbi:MAG: hypothetical protein U0269_01640 [Polyangiales bacterium]